MDDKIMRNQISKCLCAETNEQDLSCEFSAKRSIMPWWRGMQTEHACWIHPVNGCTGHSTAAIEQGSDADALCSSNTALSSANKPVWRTSSLPKLCMVESGVQVD